MQMAKIAAFVGALLIVTGALCGCSRHQRIELVNDADEAISIYFQNWLILKGWQYDAYEPISLAPQERKEVFVSWPSNLYILVRRNGRLVAWAQCDVRGEAERIVFSVFRNKSIFTIQKRCAPLDDWFVDFFAMAFFSFYGIRYGAPIVLLFALAALLFPAASKVGILAAKIWRGKVLFCLFFVLFVMVWIEGALATRPDWKSLTKYPYDQHKILNDRFDRYFHSLQIYEELAGGRDFEADSETKE